MVYTSSIKAQAAIEFLTTYGWAIMILMIVLAFAFYLLSSQATIVSTICTINSGFKCTEFLIESNTISSTALFFLNNIQQYPVKGTTVTANISSVGTITAKCSPNFVLPGGDMICTSLLSQTFSNTLSIGGKISVNSTVCTDISNPISCNKKYPINYTGTLYTRVVGYAPQQCSISVSSNTENPGINIPYPIYATVKINNNPIPGATVNFSSTSSSLKISPSFINTETNGTATTYVTSTSTGSNTITATFYNTCSSSLSLSFSTTPGSSGSSTVYYAPITLSNQQSSGTSSGFQQMIYFNPSTYSSNEMANLSNIEFTTGAPIGTSGNVPLYAWIESGASSSATNTVTWVNLASNTLGAAGSGTNTLTIYMNFLPNNSPVTSGYTGYAPQLYCASGCFQTSYAQYDNGASVFNFYDNFAGTTINSEWTQIIPSGTTISQNNGITISTSSSSTYGGLILTTGYTGTQIFEGDITAVSGVAAGFGLQNGNLGSSDGVILTYWSGSVSTGSMSGGLSNYNIPNLQLSTGIDGGAWLSSSSQIWYKDYIATTGSQTLTLPSTIYPSIGIWWESTSTSIKYQWLRTRSYPPNGVMPSSSFGGVV